MKNRLITIATVDIIYECFPILETQRAYAAARGFEHRVISKPAWPDLHPSFSKVQAILDALEDGVETVVWADADVAFMDRQWNICDLVGGEWFMAAYWQRNWPPPGSGPEKNWKYLCAGLSVWRNTPEAHRYVNLWKDYCLNGEPYSTPGQRFKVTWKPWEQWSQDLINRIDFKYEGIRACTENEIGCFSRELWNDGILFEPGMPTVHFAGDHSWADRRQTYIDHYEKLVRP